MIPFSLQRWLPLTLIALLGFWLRIHDLESRPMHADEANQAVKLGELLETGHYAFDPHDHHGPTLYYLAWPIAWFRGERTLAALTEPTVRLLPAIAGTLSIFLLAALVSSAPSGNATHRFSSRDLAALAAAGFVAVSPPAVYYSRYFVQETLLATFTLATFVAAKCWWRRPSILWALTTGAGVGLMLATKASAPLFLIAGGIGGLATWRRSNPTRQPALASSAPTIEVFRRPARDAVIAGLAALIVAALFYSSFGTHISGLGDAVRVYTFATERAATGAGHEKPWWYYLHLFAWQKNGGLVWEQLAFTTLALCGAALAFTRPFSGTVFRWALITTAIVTAALSLTPYKTPWHTIHLVPGLAILAAGALAAIPRWWIGALLALIVGQLQYANTRLAVFQRAADPRNPYAYVHSSPDVTKFRAPVEAALARSPDAIVRIISAEYWPLPWYLRGLPRIGYWPTPPHDCDAALVIASADLAEAVRAKLHGNYRESLLGIRPGLLCVLFTRAP